ncbi:MAG: endonuclease/exonuclease/phosphatase family protein [Kiloniellaceae bacterium]
MAKAFSLASWNVEHFRGKPDRVVDVVRFLRDNAKKPDVFAIHEVTGKAVFDAMVAEMPGYQFHITEGRQTQEILVGVKAGLTAFFSQRTEFKSGSSFLRPGAFLTLRLDGQNHSILFLHTKSLPTPKGFGLRDDMLDRAFRLKRKLDKIAGGRGKANFLFLGDLNTMGLAYPFDQDIPAEVELRRLDGRASRNRMRRLGKSAPHTYWNGPGSAIPPGDLDHVVAAKHLRFKTFRGTGEVDVRGWPELDTDQEKARWIDRFSDHALLYLEIQKA